MSSAPAPQILTLLQKEAGHIPYQRIHEFVKSLSPHIISLGPNLFQGLYRAIYGEYAFRLHYSRDAKPQEITGQLLIAGSKISQQVYIALKSILHNPIFMQSIMKGIQRNLTPQSTNLFSSPSKDRTSVLTTQTYKAIGNSAPNKAKSAFNFEVIKGSNKNQQSYSKSIDNKLMQTCTNLENKPQCICLNQRQIVDKDEFSFKCSHCRRLFHTVCFKRKSTAQACCYCFIEKMSPVRRVVKTAYLGLLRKNTKKHSANFNVPVLQQNQKLQVRCLRLKDGAQNSCLFPDVAEIIVNSHRVKEFQPLNKQSCLKYRKDQPFMLLKGDYYPGQENSLLLNEAINTHREKEIRYESQNHIFGVFVIEDIKIQSLISQMQAENIMGFSESKTVLNGGFKLGRGDDQISCELVKIPLSCPLSTMRIEIPARGIFCTHFQCFDLKNYLTLISQSQNPRWKCPLCPNLAYELQIDSITQQILKQTQDNQKIQQILFFKNGDYTSIIDDQPAKQRKNIMDLNIPEKKPTHEPPALEEPAPAKKQFLVPVNAEVIDLDD